MTDKLRQQVDDALLAFSEYQQALEDPEWECPVVAFSRLEVAMRDLQDVFDDLPIAQKGASK